MTPSAAHSMLPPLTPEEASHSQAAAQRIHMQIESAGGWIPFDQFMELALYAPGLGYYSAGSAKLGAAGDFITAPELSDLFSACVAEQCAQILAQTGGSIFELGAGTGRLAATVLKTLAALDSLPEHYYVLEVSADLRARQQQRIERLPAEWQRRVAWLDRLPETPMTGVILANEVLDALPCKRFVLHGPEIYELGVGLGTDGAFIERQVLADAALAAAVRNIESTLPGPLPDGYRSELCARVEPWLSSMGQCLTRGSILLFDYGLPRTDYYHPQRRAGTLRCHFKHRAHDNPLINVGVQDMTAWVDFTRVAQCASAAGLDVRGFATQAGFLLGAGMVQLIEQPHDPITRARRASEARQLMMPGEMGEIFKAMALVKDCGLELRGFAVQDLRRLL